MSEPSAARASLRNALLLALFALVFTALMAATHHATRGAIAASIEAERLRLVGEVLPPERYDNPLLADYIFIPPRPELGLSPQEEPLRLFRARRGGTPVALVFEAVAPDGYAGSIRLLIAIGADGHIVGVRPVSHKETPGLGDYIDPKKDRNKASPWIRQFEAIGFAEVPPAQWKVKKDGGHFDARAGATVSARAVTHAVRRALQFAEAHGRTLYALPAHATFGKEEP